MFPVVLGFCLVLPAFSLPTDQNANVNPILALFPINEVKAIAHEHLTGDPDFQAAMKYFKSPEWLGMLQKLRENKEWQQYKEYLNKFGLDLNNAVGVLDHCLNMTDTSKLDVDMSRANLSSFVNDVKSNLTVSAMKALGDVSKKMEEPEMKKLFENFSSKVSQEQFEKVAALPEFQRVVKKLTSLGINIRVGLDMVYALLGWKMTPNLLD